MAMLGGRMANFSDMLFLRDKFSSLSIELFAFVDGVDKDDDGCWRVVVLFVLIDAAVLLLCEM